MFLFADWKSEIVLLDIANDKLGFYVIDVIIALPALKIKQ